MVNRYFLISFLLVLSTLKLNAQALSTDQDLRDEVRKYGQAEVTIAYPGRDETDIITRNVSIESVREGKVTISLSRRTVEWFISGKYSYYLVPRADTKGVLSASSVSEALAWQSYPTFTQYDSIMRSFAATYPSICRLDTIGTSVNGRLILALKISENVHTDGAKPQVFYTSTIHGDETGGFILMLRLADYLLTNYSTDTRVTNLVNNLEIWINPDYNVDGTYNNGDTINGPTRYNAHGEDLNRNFPDPLQSYYPEKETIEMVSFLKKHRFVLSANFHAGAEVVNYPWDRWQRLHADDTWFNYISRAYADTVHNHASAGYLTYLDNGVTNGYDWYSVYGGRQDYMTYSLQGREVTIELDYTKTTPSSQLENLWQYNWRSLVGYLENAAYGVHGLVKDATSLKPLSAEIYIHSHDKDSSQVYSDSLKGSFTRLLMPGTWNISFHAYGYRDTTLTGLVVEDKTPLNLVVYLEPLSAKSDSSYKYLPFIWPNPATSSIRCVLPQSFSGNIKVTVVDNAGKKAMEFNDYYFKGEQKEIDISALPAGSYFIVFRNLTTGEHLTSRIVVTGRFNR
jgi:hypothetical protein